MFDCGEGHAVWILAGVRDICLCLLGRILLESVFDSLGMIEEFCSCYTNVSTGIALGNFLSGSSLLTVLIMRSA